MMQLASCLLFLENKGIYDRTFIVATADHGDAMGAHRMIEKGEFSLIPPTTFR